MAMYVTTAMLVTVTTTTTTAISSLAVASLTAILVLALMALLIQKEIIGSLHTDWSVRTMARINTALPPLLAVFAITVSVRIYDLLR